MPTVAFGSPRGVVSLSFPRPSPGEISTSREVGEETPDSLSRRRERRLRRTHPPLSVYEPVNASGPSANLVLLLRVLHADAVLPVLTDDHTSTRSTATRSTNHNVHHGTASRVPRSVPAACTTSGADNSIFLILHASTSISLHSTCLCRQYALHSLVSSVHTLDGRNDNIKIFRFLL